jgi:hypothetical protein
MGQNLQLKAGSALFSNSHTFLFTMTPSFKWLVLSPLLIALAACGGGGGDDGNPAGGVTPSSTPTNWSAQAYVKASNADGGDFFGSSVAIDGDTMVVGAVAEDSSLRTVINGIGSSSSNSARDAGAVYVYVRNGGNWIQQAYLKAPNAEAGDAFGTSVAISGDTIVVGALLEDSSQTTITNGSTASADNTAGGSGAAYVFVRNTANGTWIQQAYLKAPNAKSGDEFGTGVAISGDTIVVGAFREGSSQTTITNGSTASADNAVYASGAAYVFVRSGSTWSQQAYLKAPNAEASDVFGISVDISGDTIVVGASFEASAQNTISNGTAASADNTARLSGAAYVFVRSGSSWSQQAYLKAANAQASDFFGDAVAISGDTIVVGASGEDSSQTTITQGSTASVDNSADGSGAAYVFVRSGLTWSQQAYLKAPNADVNDAFGRHVAVHGDTIVIGVNDEAGNQTSISNGSTASADNAASHAGAAYVFVRSGSSWSQQAYLKAPNAEADDNFGLAVAVHANTILVGAVGEASKQTSITNGGTASGDNSASFAGAAYVFARN